MKLANIIRPIAFTVPYELFITHDICHVVVPGTLTEILGIHILTEEQSDKKLFEIICKLLNNKGNFTCVGFIDHRV